jgi:phosphotransferase system enzyme I (PtsI)
MSEYFRALENELFAQRAYDYEDVGQRMLAHLSGNSTLDLDKLSPKSIPVIHNATPSLVIGFFNKGVKGFCTQHGSHTSHCAILAKSMGITYITGIASLLSSVKDGDNLLMDGNQGVLFINPDSSVLKKYDEIISKEESNKKRLQEFVKQDSITLDQQRVTLSVNMELPEEIELIKKLNVDSIGLFRTEFLYLENDLLPTEEEQFKIYSYVLENMKGKPVTIRTMDLGGDKFVGLQSETERNPYLGCRGIRFSLQHPHLLKTQIRALLRAGRYGNLKVMFPMINDLSDYRNAMKIVSESRLELSQEKITFSDKIMFGAMIEVPSAAITSDELAEECDFFSIGTNDLTQYTVAVDRNNEGIAHLFNPHHAAVLRLMVATLNNAVKKNIPVSICGEIASSTKYIPLLLKLGFRDLSVNPRLVAEIKEQIINLDLTKLVDLNSSELSQRSIDSFLKNTE